MREVMPQEDLGRVIRRIAHEIVERNHGTSDLVLAGVATRGKPFADRIAQALSEIDGREVIAGTLDIAGYRDDLESRSGTHHGRTDIAEDIDGRTVVVADDVLYTGRTIRAALDALADMGRPAAVQLAVVVDRGHRQLPIRADYVGKNVPTAKNERVFVRFEETDGEEGVWIDQGESK